MTKDEVVKILNDNSQKSVIGWAIEEDDFNEVAEKIVKLCNLQNVTNRALLLKIERLEAGNKLLNFMVENGLGEEDMINDIGKK